MKSKNIKLPWYRSIQFTIFLLMFIISAIPTLLMFYIDYRINYDNLENIAKNQLQKENHLHKELIDNWFKSTDKQIKLLTQSKNTITFFQSIHALYQQKSNPSIDSYAYALLENQYDHDYKKTIKTVDYIHDIFLIDLKGNILYSLKKKPDLGTNLMEGIYSKSKFAQSFQRTLESGLTSFSDLEKYPPSQEMVSGFITQLLIDEQGEVIGVFAVQIQPNFIIDILQKSDLRNLHYIVGVDGYLRNDTITRYKALEDHINNTKLKHWYQKHSENKEAYSKHHEQLISYHSIHKEKVFGIHNSIEIFGTHWLLVSEIQHNFLYAQIHESLKALVLALILLSIFSILISIYLSNHISKPIKELAFFSYLFSEGIRQIGIKKTSSNEIGQLQKNFQKMINTIKQNEKDIEEANQKAKLAIASAKAGTIFFDIKKGYLEWDKRSMEIFGVNQTSFHNDFESWSRCVHPNDIAHATNLFEKALKDQNNLELHYRIIHPNGELRFVRANANIVRNDQGEALYFTGLHFDETEYKQTQEALIDTKNEALEANKAKSQFLAHMSHEIRTPMNAIIGMSYLALQNELDPKVKNYIQKVHRSGEGLLQIINDILDYSKIEARKLAIESVPFSLKELLEDMNNIVELKAQEKNIKILYDIGHDVPRFLKGDPLRLGQILLNLGNNAVKFTPQDGEILIAILVKQENQESVHLQFSVNDTGVGISHSKLQTLFEAFSQEDSSTTRQYGGTGLGLTISKNLVELLGGKIWVESIEKEGSTFYFSIPMEVSSQAKKRVELPHNLLQNKKVLIVDESTTSIKVLSHILSNFQLSIESANSGNKALEMIQNMDSDHPYDFLLMDWEMPKLNAMQTIQKIRANLKINNTPIIIMVTLHDKEEVQKQTKDLHNISFITKPIIEEGLLNSMIHAMGIKTQTLDIENIFQKDLHESLRALSGANILLVEDNDINRELAFDLLSSNGMHVTLAHNGQEAVEKVQQDRYDGVLMDCQMPIMDGDEATRIIRSDQRFAKLPILAMTANAMKGDKESVLRAGMNDHIPKPIDPAHLFSTMAKWIKPQHPIPIKAPPKENKQHNKALPTLDGINTLKGLKSVMGSIPKYKELLIKFRTREKTFTQEFQIALKAQNYEHMTRLSHTLKGLSGTIGAMELYRCAYELEQKSLTKNINEIQKQFDEVVTALNRVLQALKSVTLTNTDTHSIDLEDDKIKELLDQLKTQLRNYNPKAKTTLELLQSSQKMQKHRETLSQIATSIHRYHFEEGYTTFENTF